MVFVFFGSRLLGWCNYVQRPNGRRWAVATRFVHVFFIPLIPLGTRLVVEGADYTCYVHRVIPIPFSCYSWLIAWVRFLFLGLLFWWKPEASEARERELIAFVEALAARQRGAAQQQQSLAQQQQFVAQQAAYARAAAGNAEKAPLLPAKGAPAPYPPQVV